MDLKRFRNYCGLIKIVRSGFPWEKTTKGSLASVYTNRETAVRKRHAAVFIGLFAGIFCAPGLHADERKIDPTFLYRDTSTVSEKKSDLTTATCHYKPLFGQGDADTSVVVGVARYGEAVIDPKGVCAAVQYPERRPGVRCPRGECIREIRK